MNVSIVWQGSSPVLALAPPRLWLLRRSPAKRFTREAIFLVKKQKSQSRFGSSKTATAPLEEPLKRSHAKHRLSAFFNILVLVSEREVPNKMVKSVSIFGK